MTITPSSKKIKHKIKHFKEMFIDKRTYANFQVIVQGIIALRDWKEADLAYWGEKTLRQVQFFFNGAKWCYKILNDYRLKFLRNNQGFVDSKDDFVVLDGSAVEKNKDSHFSDLAHAVYSNKAKKVVNGFYLFGASVITKAGIKYLLDFKLFFLKTGIVKQRHGKAFPKVLQKKQKHGFFF